MSEHAQSNMTSPELQVYLSPPTEFLSIQTADTPTRRLIGFFSNLVSDQKPEWTITNDGQWVAKFRDLKISFATKDEKIDTTSLQIDILDPKAEPEANPIASLTLVPRYNALLKSQVPTFETHLNTSLSDPDRHTLWQKIDNRLATLETDGWISNYPDDSYFYSDVTLYAKQALRKIAPVKPEEAKAVAALVLSAPEFVLPALQDSSAQYPVRPEVGSPEDIAWRQNYTSIDTNPISEQYETEASYERFLLHIDEDYRKDVPLTDDQINALTDSSRQAWETYHPYVRESDFGFWQLATLDVIRNMYSAFGEIPDASYLATLHKGMMDSLMMGDDYYINFRAMRMNEETSVSQGNELANGGLLELNQIQNRWNVWITGSYSRLFSAGLIPEQSLLENPRQLFESLEGVDEFQLKYYIFAIEKLGVPPGEVVDFYKKYFSAQDLFDSDDPDSQPYAENLGHYAEALRDGNVPRWLPITQGNIDNIPYMLPIDENAFTGFLNQNQIAELAPIVIPTTAASTSTPSPTQTPEPTATPMLPAETQTRQTDHPQEDQGHNKAIAWLLRGGAVTATLEFLRRFAKRRARMRKKISDDFSSWYGQ